MRGRVLKDGLRGVLAPGEDELDGGLSGRPQSARLAPWLPPRQLPLEPVSPRLWEPPSAPEWLAGAHAATAALAAANAPAEMNLRRVNLVDMLSS